MREGYEPARPFYAARPQDGHAPYASDPSVMMAAEVARFFRDLRGALGLTPEHAAHALATRVDIIAAFEQGQIGALPPWPETCRIVRTYAGFAQLDPRPILHQLEQLTIMAPREPVPPVHKPRQVIRQVAAPRATRAQVGAALGERGKRAAHAARTFRDALNDRAGRPGMALFTVTMGIALVLLVTTQTAVLEAAVGQLPSPMKRFVRGAQDYVIVQFAPVRDGLRWIDVDDPRSRRSDKLQTAAQSD